MVKQLTIADVDAHFYARPGSHSLLTISQILEEYDTGRLKASDAAEMLCALPRERSKPRPLTATEFRQYVNALRHGLRQCIERLIPDEALRPTPAPVSAANDVLDSASARISLALLRMLLNESQLEIETVGPYASRHIDSNGKVDVTVDNMSKDERIGLMLGAALRFALRSQTNVRFVSLLDELHDLRETPPGVLEDDAQGDAFIIGIARLYVERGYLSNDDIPGLTCALVREGAFQELAAIRADELWDRELYKGSDVTSGKFVYPLDPGERKKDRPEHRPLRYPQLWIPEPKAVDVLGNDRYISRNRRDFKGGILLFEPQGKASCQLLDAERLWMFNFPHTEHIVALDIGMRAQQDQRALLASQSGLVRRSHDHNLFWRSSVAIDGQPRKGRKKIELPERAVVAWTLQGILDRLDMALGVDPHRGSAWRALPVLEKQATPRPSRSVVLNDSQVLDTARGLEATTSDVVDSNFVNFG